MALLLYTVVALLTLSHARADNSTETDSCGLEPWDVGPWSSLLEEWATSATEHNERQGRVMALPPAPGYYITNRVDRPPPPPYHHAHGHGQHGQQHGPPQYSSQHNGPSQYNGPTQHNGPPQHNGPQSQHGSQHDGSPSQYSPPQHNGPTSQHDGTPSQYSPQLPNGPQAYSEWAPSPPPAPAASKIVNRPPNPYKDKYKPDYSSPPASQQIPAHRPPPPQSPHRGPGPVAVDRVDEPPRKQVTETDLYLLSAIEKLVYRADLMEKRLRKIEESLHHLVVGKETKPEPCVANFTRVGATCYHFSEAPTDWKTANVACRKLRGHLLELDDERERRTLIAGMLADKRIRGLDVWTGGLNPGLLWIWSHSARAVQGNSSANGTDSGVTITGDGRCLALVHDPAVNTYVYRGQDCALRHRYVCEKEEDKQKLSNEIERVARSLRPFRTAAKRTARLLADNAGPQLPSTDTGGNASY